MKKFYMDLQMFDEIEIPAELEGVSKDVALEIMKEAGIGKSANTQTSENTGSQIAQTSSEENNSNNSATEQVTTQPGQSASSADNSAAPDSDNNQGAEGQQGQEPSHIPYKRFKEVNEKSKAKDIELANLKAELEALKAAQNNTTNIPTHSQPPAAGQPHQTQGQINAQQSTLSSEILQQVTDTALNNTLKNLGMTQDDLAEMEYSEDPMEKMRFQTAYNMELNRILMEANSIAERQRREVEQRNMIQQQVNTEYINFANEIKKQPDFEAFWNYAANEKFNTLNPMEKQILNDAFVRAQNGQASPQDFLLVKNYFTATQSEFKAKQAANPVSVQTQQANPAKKVETKIKQMEAHPKASQVIGTNSQGGYTIADLERMIQEQNWEDIPQELRDLAMGLK